MSTVAAIITMFTVCGQLMFVNVATMDGKVVIGTPDQISHSQEALDVIKSLNGKQVDEILVKWDEVVGMQCG